jgi:arsenate reductase-like glutaredoxin family protein
MTVPSMGGNPQLTARQISPVNLDAPALPDALEVGGGAGDPLKTARLKYSLDSRYREYNAIVRADQGEALDAKQDGITDDELKSIFGDQAEGVRSLLNSRSDVKLGDLLPLRRNPELFSKTIATLNKRSDLPFSSLIQRDVDGSVMVDSGEFDVKMKLKRDIADDVSQDKLSDEELDALFGDQSKQVRELMKTRSEIKLSELLPLRNDKKGLDDLSRLLTERKDFSYNDLVSKSADGKVSITWSVSDEQSKDIMETRKDIKPKELSALFGTLVKAFDGDPKMAKRAYAQAAKLLKNRADISPQAVGKMVVDMNEQLETIRPEVPNSGQMMNAARMDMLESSVDVLCKRKDLTTEDMTRLSESTVKSFGSKKDPLSLSRVSRSFRDATEMLGKRPDINVGQVTGFMSKLDSTITGADPASLESKASLFKTSCTLLAKRGDMNFSHMENLLDKKAQGKPPGNGFAIASDFRRDAGLLEEGKNPDAERGPAVAQEDGPGKAEGQKEAAGEKKPEEAGMGAGSKSDEAADQANRE